MEGAEERVYMLKLKTTKGGREREREREKVNGKGDGVSER
jgi:hypothetical protein